VLATGLVATDGAHVGFRSASHCLWLSSLAVHRGLLTFSLRLPFLTKAKITTECIYMYKYCLSSFKKG